jgi:hypothetical protein
MANSPLVPQAASWIDRGTLLTTITNITAVPVYPGAEPYDNYCEENPPDKCTYDLLTTDSVEQIVEFYKATFAKNGWALAEEQGIPESPHLYFVWTNSAGISPSRFFVGISISPSGFEEGKRAISVRFERWPDSQKIPLYKDAYDTQVKKEDPRGNWLEDTVTTYKTKASPDEIRAFYKDLLTQQGWRVYMAADGSPDADIEFVYDRTEATRMIMSFGEIRVLSKAIGETQVELRIIYP